MNSESLQDLTKRWADLIDAAIDTADWSLVEELRDNIHKVHGDTWALETMKFLSPAEFGRRTGLTPSVIRKYVRTGYISALQVANTMRIPESEIRRLYGPAKTERRVAIRSKIPGAVALDAAATQVDVVTRLRAVIQILADSGPYLGQNKEIAALSRLADCIEANPDDAESQVIARALTGVTS